MGGTLPRMGRARSPGDVLLVGSMPFEAVQDVFRECCAVFGGALGNCPRGGGRSSQLDRVPRPTDLAGHPRSGGGAATARRAYSAFPRPDGQPGRCARPPGAGPALPDKARCDLSGLRRSALRRCGCRVLCDLPAPQVCGRRAPARALQGELPRLEQRDRGVLPRARRLADRRAGLRAGRPWRDRAHAGIHPRRRLGNPVRLGTKAGRLACHHCRGVVRSRAIFELRSSCVTACRPIRTGPS